MYHYVRPENSDGVTGLTPEAFEQQLRAVGERYRFVTAEEWSETHQSAAGVALITFDDAVSDQYDHAFPILERLGIPGVVYVPMRPYSDEADGWTTQHLLHALAHHIGFAELESRLAPELDKLGLDQDVVDEVYGYEVPEKRRLKYALGFALSEERARELLSSVNATVGLKPSDWFASRDQLLEIQSAGHALGGHGFAHVPYDQLSAKDQAADMHRAQELMNREFGAMARTVAFPYGRYTSETIPIALGSGYTFCFTLENRVDASDLDAHLSGAAA